MTAARFTSEHEVEEAGQWESRADFEAWWKRNVRELNRLSVTDPEEWERITLLIEAFNARNPQ